MKTKILFITEHFQMNGGARSLLNLLYALDRGRYEIHLFVFSWGDVLFSQIPDDVHLLPENRILRNFDLPLKQAIQEAWSDKLYILLFRRILAGLKARFFHSERAKDICWNDIPALDDGYDVAVGFHEGRTHRFVAEKVVAKRKIGWVHVDYGTRPCNVPAVRRTHELLDIIVTVSSAAKKAITEKIGTEAGKVAVVQNLSGEAHIRKASMLFDVPPMPTGRRLRILSIGRLTREKGFDMALEASALLKGRLPQFEWIIIGEGQDRGELEAEIVKRQLQDHVILLGEQANPYPWLASCDVYVQPSRTESWGMAITEAKLFAKAIIASDIPAFREQIVSGETGILVKPSAQAYADALARVATDQELRAKLEAGLVGFTSADHDILPVFDEVIVRL